MKKGSKTRGEILAAAFHLASTHGLSGLTIGELAKQVGMSKSGLFAHFRSKERLQLAVLEWVSELFVANVLSPSLKAERGEPRIRYFFQTWLDWHNRLAGPGGCIFVSAASEFDDQPGAIKQHLAKQQMQLFRSIERMAAAAVEERHFRQNSDPKQFTFQYYSLFLGYHHCKRLLEDPEAAKRLKLSFEELMQTYLAVEGVSYDNLAAG